MIEPTVGRVVWVHRPDAPSLPHCQPEMAWVVFVHGPRCVNVVGYDMNGEYFFLRSCQLLQDDDGPSTGVYAWWMPYQKGQAAKTEALEQRLPRCEYVVDGNHCVLQVNHPGGHCFKGA